MINQETTATTFNVLCVTAVRMAGLAAFKAVRR